MLRKRSNNRDLYVGNTVEPARAASEGVRTDGEETVGQVLVEQT